MKLGQFSDEAINAAKQLLSDSIEFSELETMDFARCQRADGSFYGTGGQCRMGKETGAKEAAEKKPKKSGSSEETGKNDSSAVDVQQEIKLANGRSRAYKKMYEQTGDEKWKKRSEEEAAKAKELAKAGGDSKPKPKESPKSKTEPKADEAPKKRRTPSEKLLDEMEAAKGKKRDKIVDKLADDMEWRGIWDKYLDTFESTVRDSMKGFWKGNDTGMDDWALGGIKELLDGTQAATAIAYRGVGKDKKKGDMVDMYTLDALQKLAEKRYPESYFD